MKLDKEISRMAARTQELVDLGREPVIQINVHVCQKCKTIDASEVEEAILYSSLVIDKPEGWGHIGPFADEEYTYVCPKCLNEAEKQGKVVER